MTLPEDSQNLCGYGPFTLPLDHPFTPICQGLHDPAYDAYLKGFPTRPLSVADKAMLSGMLGIAKEKDSLGLTIQAYAYYGLTTVFRWIFRN